MLPLNLPVVSRGCHTDSLVLNPIGFCGWIYNRVAKTGVPVKGKGVNKPLYDTGTLYNDFDYEVKSR